MKYGDKVAANKTRRLDDTQLGLGGLGFLDGDDALVADLLHRLGDHLADRLVAIGQDGIRPAPFRGLDLLGSLAGGGDASVTARSMPRFRSIGFMPAATALWPSWTIAWARTVAFVVPSPRCRWS